MCIFSVSACVISYSKLECASCWLTKPLFNPLKVSLTPLRPHIKTFRHRQIYLYLSPAQISTPLKSVLALTYPCICLIVTDLARVIIKLSFSRSWAKDLLLISLAGMNYKFKRSKVSPVSFLRARKNDIKDLETLFCIDYSFPGRTNLFQAYIYLTAKISSQTRFTFTIFKYVERG